MKMKIPIFLVVLLLSSAVHRTLYGGTTGKITGQITDAGTREALIGANIMIKGSSIGTASDLDGNYFILNIPPGIYTVSISMMGYQPIQLTQELAGPG